MGGNAFKINLNIIALFLVFIAGTLRWFFSGVISRISGLNGTDLQIWILMLAIFLCIMGGKVHINRLSCIWLLYVFSLFVNICIHRLFDANTIKSFIIVLEIVAFSIVYNGNFDSNRRIFKVWQTYGIINAIFVMIHFVSGDSFINIYGNLLTEGALKTAKHYVELGHYFGFGYLPADTAGAIAFTLVALIIARYFIGAKFYKKHPILSAFPVLLIVPLLLTGKKGILFLSIIAFAFTVLLIYASKKQWIKALRFIAVGTLIILVAYQYIVTHQNVELFQRLNEFFVNLATGENYDSSRIDLWGYALDAWQNNKLFGIGWRTFSDLTTVIYGSPHEVNCDYLQILCETGIIGAFLTFLPMIIMLYRTVKTCRFSTKYIEDPFNKWVVLCSCFYQFFILIYAVIEIPFYDTAFFGTYMLSCIVVNDEYSRRKKRKTFFLLRQRKLSSTS